MRQSRWRQPGFPADILNAHTLGQMGLHERHGPLHAPVQVVRFRRIMHIALQQKRFQCIHRQRVRAALATAEKIMHMQELRNQSALVAFRPQHPQPAV